MVREHGGEDARPVVGAPGCLFLIGTVLPSVWAIWVVARVAIGNSAFWGQPPVHRTYFREMPELWVTAGALTLTALVFIGMLARSNTHRGSKAAFGFMTLAAAAGNWAILFTP